MKRKPKLSFWDIWNMSFGFLGVQMGFALQNANASRILQTFGADVEHLGWFWLVAPITGLIVQPIIGHYSDQTWTKMGRRRPFFLIGAIFAALGLLLMPNAAIFTAFAPAMYIGAGFLMMMDASFNVAMEPFRALVADKLPTDQRTLGFSVQTTLIGIGAVIGSWLPYVLTNFFDVANEDPNGGVPLSLILSFSIGAAVLLSSIVWTVASTSEYSPEEQAEFSRTEAIETSIIKEEEELDTEIVSEGLGAIFTDFAKMPLAMKQLGVTQFFSWFALFGMWVFTTPAIAQHIYALPANDTSSATFNEAGNWVGVIFGVYNAVSAVFAYFFLPVIAKMIGRKMTHAISLIVGAIGLISIYFIKDPNMLVVSMIGIGIAWASILAMPYAILAGSIPAKKMGVYMGIFNFFIVIPQIVNGLLGGYVIKNFYNNQAIYALVAAGISLVIAAISVYFVDDVDDINTTER